MKPYVVEELTDTVKICTTPCWICGHGSYLTVPRQAWKMFEHHNEPLHIAWPDGTAADKLLIQTGVHPKCWDEEFPDDVPKEQ